MKGAWKQGRHRIHPGIPHTAENSGSSQESLGLGLPAQHIPVRTRLAWKALLCYLLWDGFLVSQLSDIEHLRPVWVRDLTALGQSP